MFKRMITLIIVVMVVMSLAISANAVCTSESGRPDIIGMEHFDAIKEIADREDDYEYTYEISMARIEDYWLVYLEGYADGFEGYVACGIYDHTPTEEEFDILWANRMLEDEMDELMEEYGF